MRAMKRDDWPGLMDGAKQSVLILAPWIDDVLIEELFSLLPPVDVRILFPRTTLEAKGTKGMRYALRGVLDTNFDAQIRVTDEALPACLLVDDAEFFYSENYASLLAERASDEEGAIAYAKAAWDKGQPWG